MNDCLYRIEVAPLVILPLGRSPFFSYASPKKVAPGSLVSISFGKHEIKGVVFDYQSLPGKKPHWMKNISSVLVENFLDENQCSLAEEISREYFTPLGRVLIHFIPKVARARKKKERISKQIVTLLPSKEEALVLKKASLASKDLPLFLDTSSFPNAAKLVLLLAKKLSSKGQVLIIVPEITLVFALEKILQESFPFHEIGILHSLLSDGPFYETWEKIRNGKAKIILATRQGLFAPYKKLAAILFTEEQDESYKQWDMSPRYHAKRVAEILAKIHETKLILTSNTPSIESLFQIQNKKYRLIRPISTSPPLSPTFVNLRLERYKKNFSPFSSELTDRIYQTLVKKGQILLYINRQGMNVFSVCNSCKNVFRCKECGHPLSNTKEGYFRCLSCGYKTSLFPNCPACGDLTFKHIGFGTEKIEKEARKLFPQANIARLDGSLLRAVKDTREIFEKAQDGKIDILIGTQMILKDPPLPKLTLVAMIDADSLLFFPDFKADERLYQHIRRASQQVKERGVPSHKAVVVQTFHPESTLFQKFKELDSKSFSDKILSDRNALFFPPYSRLISITVRQKTKDDSENKSRAIAGDLKRLIPKSYKIHPEHSSELLKKKKVFESTILMRMPADETIPEKLVAFLQRISKDCIIDIDPISFR